MKKLLYLTALIVATQAESSQYVFRYDGKQPGSLTVELYSGWQGGNPFERVELDEGVNKQRTVGTTNNLDHLELIDNTNGVRYTFSFSNYKLHPDSEGKPLSFTISFDPSTKMLKVVDNRKSGTQSFKLKKMQ